MASVLADALREIGLEQVLDGTSAEEIAGLERLALLAKLKEMGVGVLSDRQKIASAVAKANRAKPSSSTISTARNDLMPQEFSVYCHNTTLADGTQLNNDEPAPEFIIAALEQQTKIKRPPNADQTPLHNLHLHFMMGGGNTGDTLDAG